MKPTTEKLPRPTMNYPSFYGKLSALISMYEIGVTSRYEFLKKANAVAEDYEKQCKTVLEFLDLPMQERIDNYEKP